MRRARFLLFAALAAAAGCAQSTTVVLTSVDVDLTVPPLLLLRTTLTSASNPALTSSSAIRSLAQGDAQDRPAPFVFPLVLPISAGPSFAGEAIITVDGLDWVSMAVIATGRMTATVVAGQRTTVELIMTGVGVAGGGDGGAGDGGAGDGGVRHDAAAAD